MTRRMTMLVLLIGVAGCGAEVDAPDGATSTGGAGQAAGSFRPVLDDHQLMSWVLDPATDVVWGAAGSVITADGEQKLAPVDDEGWVTVRNAAAMVTEAGNLLMLPGRSRGEDWNELARGLVTIGQRAIAAAQAHDDEALFEAGGQLYNVCVACHQVYMLDQEPAAP